MLTLTPGQLSVVEAPAGSRVFLSGPAGCGKTTAALEHMRLLLAGGVPADQVLVLAPQRTLQDPYLNLIHSPQMQAGGEVTPATIGGLARRMLDLFWPLAADLAGVAHPEKPPVFLTLETAQYYMAYLVRPHLKEGWFESVTMDPNRLYSQVLDNLNKAAMIGFPHEEIGQRLSAAWSGEPAQQRVYTDTQACASEFRAYCLEHNLLDFSLQLEIFSRVLWNDLTVRSYLTHSYRHIIYDNLEEDVPIAHDILADWLPECDSALLVFDEGAGYRSFLGADPQSARGLEALCDRQVVLDESFITSPALDYLTGALEGILLKEGPAKAPAPVSLEGALQTQTARFYPELLDAAADEIQRLVQQENIPPGEIVLLSPYLSDALRFSLMNRLQARDIPVRSHRPSRSLRDEPASLCLLTLAALAHPSWEIRPHKIDVVQALIQAVDGLDLVRAQLLTEIVYRQKTGTFTPFEKINPDMQARITYVFGERFTRLKEWLENYSQSEPQPLDHFLRLLFGEVLSQAGFGFHHNLDAARVASSLIESVQKFRQAMEPTFENASNESTGKEYISMLNDGVIAAQYISAWSTAPEGAVLLAPAYTYLMSNRPVSVQFWLDAGSAGWYERLYQPLTHPYVLSRHWAPGRIWTDADETEASTAALARLLGGLLRRCRQRVYLCLADLDESGYEQRGLMLRVFQQVFQQVNSREEK